MQDKVLIVDDEAGILSSFERMLRRDFLVDTALSGKEGLQMISEDGPYAVVISDMQMPTMNGAEFLSQVAHYAPDTARILLTGQANLEAIVDVINRGNILRFLLKPCSKEGLEEAIREGFEFYHERLSRREGVVLARHASKSSNKWRQEAVAWDNFGGPTGLPGPSQAISYMAPLMGLSTDCFVVLFKINGFNMMVRRHGENAAGDYLNIQAHYLIERMRSEDKLFHWGKDILMAVIQRQLGPSSMAMEMHRIIGDSKNLMVETGSRRIMVSGTIQSDFISAFRFETFADMMEAFDPSLFQ